VRGKARLAAGTDSVQQLECPTIQVPVRPYLRAKFAIIALEESEKCGSIVESAWWQIHGVEGREAYDVPCGGGEIQVLKPVFPKFKVLVLGGTIARMEFLDPSFQPKGKSCQVRFCVV
jgi:hypothetical protein